MSIQGFIQPESANMPCKNPIVSLTHAIRHCGLWLISSRSDKVFNNPNFDPQCEQPTTIYCIHGTADRSECFRLLAQRLQGELPPSIKSIHLVSFHHRARGVGIGHFAKQLRDKIQANGDQRVLLMGHSRGGLVAAHYAEKYAQDSEVQVDAVIPISAPFRGSYLATKVMGWLSRSVNQMRSQSGFLSTLNQRVKQSSIPYYYFGAKNDRVVSRWSFLPTHLNPSASSVTHYDRHGHLSILSSWRLRDAIASLLKQHYPVVEKAQTLEL